MHISNHKIFFCKYHQFRKVAKFIKHIFSFSGTCNNSFVHFKWQDGVCLYTKTPFWNKLHTCEDWDFYIIIYEIASSRAGGRPLLGWWMPFIFSLRAMFRKMSNLGCFMLHIEYLCTIGCFMVWHHTLFSWRKLTHIMLTLIMTMFNPMWQLPSRTWFKFLDPKL